MLLVPLTKPTIRAEDRDIVKEADVEVSGSIEDCVGIGEAELSAVLSVCKGKVALLLVDDGKVALLLVEVAFVQLPDWHDPMPQNAVPVPHAPERSQQSPHFPAQSRLPYLGPQVPSVP
jgi:hypothetical protein